MSDLLAFLFKLLHSLVNCSFAGSSVQQDRINMKLAEQLAQNTTANWDEATQQQQQDIEDEIASQQPLISKKLQISDIQREYATGNNAVYASKAKEISSRYSAIRRVRGDGNCFYRAFAFAQCEKMAASESGLNKFIENASKWKERLLKLGFPEMTTEDFCDTFVDTVSKFKTDADVMDVFIDQGQSNYLVVFMRLVTSGYLQEHQEVYSDFIEGGRTVKDYCAQEVEPMARECDHLCISALTEALDIPLRIEYMDQSLSPGQGTHHDFGLKKPTDVPSMHFLYRPGHYDILYK